MQQAVDAEVVAGVGGLPAAQVVVDGDEVLEALGHLATFYVQVAQVDPGPHPAVVLRAIVRLAGKMGGKERINSGKTEINEEANVEQNGVNVCIATNVGSSKRC